MTTKIAKGTLISDGKRQKKIFTYVTEKSGRLQFYP